MDNILEFSTIIFFFILGSISLFLTFSTKKGLLFNNKKVITDENKYIKDIKILYFISSLLSFVIIIALYFNSKILLVLGCFGFAIVNAYIYLVIQNR